MNLEFLILGGYWYFVWPAFVFTFVSCFFLYFKSKKEFLKQKEIFLKEFGLIQTINPEVSDKEEDIKGTLAKKSI